MNQIHKEWEKIKDTNIFPSFNDFEKLFNSNPNGRCFRKFTAYPWSKENFFFGTYDELLEYYKTSTEVPFYLQKDIGKRFGSLTVSSFEIKFVKGKRQIFAISKCDCGNMCEANYDLLLKGDKKSCGCRHKPNDKTLFAKYPQYKQYWSDKNKNISYEQVKLNDSTKYWWTLGEGNALLMTCKELISRVSKKQPIDSIGKLYPNFCKNHWDYTKNSENPIYISIRSQKPIWLIDNRGNSYQSTPKAIFSNNNSTSFPEQAVFYFLKQYFNDAENRVQLVAKDGEILEADIFIPSKNYVIEYDGMFWHKDKLLHDNLKRASFCELGLSVINIREYGLPALDDTKGVSIIRSISGSPGYHLSEIICAIISTIDKNITPEITSELIKNVRPKIYAQYKSAYKEHNFASSCLINFYDQDENYPLNPENFSISEKMFITLICPQQRKFNLNISIFKDIENCKKEDCKYCYYAKCPLALEMLFNRFHIDIPNRDCCKTCAIFKEIIIAFNHDLQTFNRANFQFPYWYKEYKKDIGIIEEYQQNKFKFNKNSTERDAFITKYINSQISFWDYNPSIETMKDILMLFKNKAIGVNLSFFDTSKNDRLWFISYMDQLIKHSTITQVINFYFHNTFLSIDMNIKNISDDFKILILDWLSNMKETPIDVRWVMDRLNKTLSQTNN